MDTDNPEPKPRRPFSTFSTLRKESSAEEDVTLYNERRSKIVPVTRSPFIEMPAGPPEPEVEVEYAPDELKVYVSEIPWSDLLLEIAMTTAFASLTDGTPILEGDSVASYLSFFALVWWVWASQVAYNVRFRQSDWLHRCFVFLQLLVFCALAAFTNSFDITNGIANDSKEQALLTEIQLSDFVSQQDISVANYRNNRLPTFNARGISMTMGFSRLVLLMQYALAFYHVPRGDVVLGEIVKRRVPRSAFLIHIGVLAFSSLCYFVAFAVIGKNPNEADQIAKLLLWYLPLLIEVASHFVAASIPGRVRYNAEAIYSRSSTVFIIILGGGLDKITNGFQYIVGNVSIGGGLLGLILCAGIIFILLFTLYFGSSQGDRLGSRRALALFFFSFFYLSALIVTLQGISSMLEVGNIGNGLETPFGFVTNTQAILESKGFGVYLNESDYSYEQTHLLNKSGIALTTLLDYINGGMDLAVNYTDYNTTINQTDYNLPYNYLLQADIYIIAAVLTNLNAYPADGSLLYANMSAFFDNDPWNYTIVNNQTFNDLAGAVIVTNATPALWFYAAGGSVIVLLALMNLINRWPRDKYEWGQTISRLLVGSLTIAMSAVDVHASSDILDDNLQYQGSRIWYLATHSWVLPPYALALLVEQLIELALLYKAGRSYDLSGFSVFMRKVTRIRPYTRTRTTDPHPPSRQSSMGKVNDEPEEVDGYFDPYAPYDSEKYIPLSRPVSAATVVSPSPGAPSFDSQENGRHSQAGSGRTRRNYRQMSSESSMQPLISR